MTTAPRIFIFGLLLPLLLINGCSQPDDSPIDTDCQFCQDIAKTREQWQQWSSNGQYDKQTIDIFRDALAGSARQCAQLKLCELTSLESAVESCPRVQDWQNSALSGLNQSWNMLNAQVATCEEGSCTPESCERLSRTEAKLIQVEQTLYKTESTLQQNLLDELIANTQGDSLTNIGVQDFKAWVLLIPGGERISQYLLPGDMVANEEALVSLDLAVNEMEWLLEEALWQKPNAQFSGLTEPLAQLKQAAEVLLLSVDPNLQEMPLKTTNSSSPPLHSGVPFINKADALGLWLLAKARLDANMARLETLGIKVSETDNINCWQLASAQLLEARAATIEQREKIQQCRQRLNCKAVDSGSVSKKTQTARYLLDNIQQHNLDLQSLYKAGPSCGEP